MARNFSFQSPHTRLTEGKNGPRQQPSTFWANGRKRSRGGSTCRGRPPARLRAASTVGPVGSPGASGTARCAPPCLQVSPRWRCSQADSESPLSVTLSTSACPEPAAAPASAVRPCRFRGLQSLPGPGQQHSPSHCALSRLTVLRAGDSGHTPHGNGNSAQEEAPHRSLG